LVLRASHGSHAPSDRVVAMVRPERIRLAEGGSAGGENRLAARIKEATYLGQDLHLSLDIDGGEVLAAVTQGSAARALMVGDAVTVAVDAADIFLLSK
jgi:ABC-type Fe3+/spermidine/putrescine transport system ATPase subunit